MQAKIYLNELSLESWALNLLDAKDCANRFIGTILALTKSGAEASLSHPQDLLTRQLTDGFTLVQWLNDSSNDRDFTTFAKSVLTKSPYFETEDKIERYGVEVKYNNQPTQGFFYAYINDGLSVSFLVTEEWNIPIIEVGIEALDANGDIEESLGNIKHASNGEHVTDHSDFIRKSILGDIVNGESLVQFSEMVFPGVILADNAKQQLKNILSGDPLLKQVIRVFSAFSDYISKWDGSQFDIDSINCDISTESAATLKKYNAERKFQCPDGNIEVFNLHAKISLNAWRIHFLPNHESKEIIVGYVGKHLSIVSEKQN